MGWGGWATPQLANGGTGGTSTFLGLTDCPASFAGQALREVRVNAAASGLEFVVPGGQSSTSVFELIDTDDDSTTEVWAVEHNSGTPGVGPRLMSVSESGLVLVGVVGVGGGSISVPGSGADSEQFGAGASAAGQSTTVVGANATAAGIDVVVVGKDASSGTGDLNVVIGSSATIGTTIQRGVSIGYNSSVSGNNGVAVGYLTTSTGASVAVGYSADAGSNSVAVGIVAQATAASSTAIGSTSDAAYPASVAIGYQATTTKANQLVIGAQSTEISEMVIGEGVSNASPIPQTLWTTTNTATTETDVRGTNIILQSGLGTGSATPTTFEWKTPTALVSGTAQQVAAIRLTILSDGTVSAPGTGADSEQFGAGAIASGAAATAVGAGATAAQNNCVVIGSGASSADPLCVVVGQGAAITGGQTSTVLGAVATATAGNGIAIGYSSESNHLGAIAIGRDIASTKANQLVIGGTDAEITEVMIGKNVSHATPSAQLLFTTTNGVGTDIHATDLVFQSGLSTGSGAVTDMIFKTPDVLTTGTTTQTAVARLTLNESSSTFTSPVGLASFTVGTLPSAAVAARTIYVSDETGGAVLAFSDGTDWRRSTDRAIVS